MARRRRPSTAKKRKIDVRKAVTTITSDIPAIPGLAPAHKAGAEAVLTKQVQVEGLGAVYFSAPSPHRLLFTKASRLIKRAGRLKESLKSHVKEVRYGGTRFSSDQEVFDFFQDAMAGVLLLHAALDSFASDKIPDDFEMETEGKRRDASYLRERGLKAKFSWILAKVTDRSNLMTKDPELWKALIQIKELRDSIAHFDPRDSWSIGESDIFTLLLNEDLGELTEAAQKILVHYDEGAFHA